MTSAVPTAAPAAVAIDGGDLTLGSGLLALIRPVLAEDMLEAVPMPERADSSTGFAPRGAQVEPGGPSYPVRLLERDHTAPPDVANLYDQAISAQWDATRDVPWSDIEPLPESLEWAVGQIMTFLAENELSALYVPAKFLPRIHPHFAEVAMLLAAQLNDEARHIDVFLKRARARGGGLGISAVVTSQSLLSLLQLEDFTEAEFLLSVLGEGTFIDLLKFIEKHAPDEPTRILVQKGAHRRDPPRAVRHVARAARAAERSHALRPAGAGCAATRSLPVGRGRRTLGRGRFADHPGSRRHGSARYPQRLRCLSRAPGDHALAPAKHGATWRR
jgi:hypothetical protein